MECLHRTLRHSSMMGVQHLHKNVPNHLIISGGRDPLLAIITDYRVISASGLLVFLFRTFIISNQEYIKKRI